MNTSSVTSKRNADVANLDNWHNSLKIKKLEKQSPRQNRGVDDIAATTGNSFGVAAVQQATTLAPVQDNQVFVAQLIRGFRGAEKIYYPAPCLNECLNIKELNISTFSAARYWHTMITGPKGMEGAFTSALRGFSILRKSITVGRLLYLVEKGTIYRRPLEDYLKRRGIDINNRKALVLPESFQSNDHLKTAANSNTHCLTEKNPDDLLLELLGTDIDQTDIDQDFNEYLQQLFNLKNIETEQTTESQITTDADLQLVDLPSVPEPVHPLPLDIEAPFVPLPNQTASNDEQYINNSPDLAQTEANSLPTDLSMEQNNLEEITRQTEVDIPAVNLSNVKFEPMDVSNGDDDDDVLFIQAHSTRPIDNSLPPLYQVINGEIREVPISEIKVNFTNLNPYLQVSPTKQKQIKNSIINQIKEYLKLDEEQRVQWYEARMKKAPSKIPGAGQGVFAVRDLPKFSFLGFFAGELINSDKALRHALEHHGIKSQFYLFENKDGNTIDPYDGNILSVMNTAKLPGQRSNRRNNVQRLPCGNGVIFVTTEDVKVGDELYVPYGANFVLPS